MTACRSSVGQVVQTVHRVEGIGSVENPLVIAPAHLRQHSSQQPGPCRSLAAGVLALSAKLHSNLSRMAWQKDPFVWICPLAGPPTPAEAPIFHLNPERGSGGQPSGFTLIHSGAASRTRSRPVATSRARQDYTDGYRTVGYPWIAALQLLPSCDVSGARRRCPRRSQV